MMAHKPENDQPNLFDDKAPPVVLTDAQMLDLAVLIKTLFTEIAAALAKEEISDE